MEKQTAVEWLVNKILTKDEIYDDYGNVIGYKLINSFTSSKDFSDYVEQAKDMERQQIMSAFMQGDIFGADYYDGVNPTDENYYNQTFKSE